MMRRKPPLYSHYRRIEKEMNGDGLGGLNGDACHGIFRFTLNDGTRWRIRVQGLLRMPRQNTNS